MKKFFGKIADKIRGLIDRYKNLGYRAKKKIKFVIGRIFLYFVLIELAYLFLLPFIYIFTTSMMSFQDYMDPTVKWIPTSIYWKNYSDAFKGLSYFGMFKGETGEKVFMSSFLNTCITSFGSAILQSVSCAIIGYALGRFKFKGRNIVFLTVILALLIPLRPYDWGPPDGLSLQTDDDCACFIFVSCFLSTILLGISLISLKFAKIGISKKRIP